MEKNDCFCSVCGFDMQTPESCDPVISEQEAKNPPAKATSTAVNTDRSLKALPFSGKRPSSRPYIIGMAVLGSALVLGGIWFSWFWVNGSQTASAQKSTLSTPSYSLNEGSYSGEQLVAINPPDGIAVEVYYTTDGTDPTALLTRYKTPIGIKNSTILKSIAIDRTGHQSAVKTAIYNITPAAAAKTTTTPPPAATASAAEKEQFKNNINGTWTRQQASGVVQYYTFDQDWLVIVEGEAKDYIPFYVNVVPGSNGTIGTVLGGKNPIAIDCNPLGDDAICIDGVLSSYSP